MDKAMSLCPGAKKLNVHACYAIFEDKSSNRTNKDMHLGRFTMANREFKSAELKRLP